MNEIKKYMIKIDDNELNIKHPDDLKLDKTTIEINEYKFLINKISYEIQLLNLELTKKNDLTQYNKIKHTLVKKTCLFKKLIKILDNMQKINNVLHNQLQDKELTLENKIKYSAFLDNYILKR